MFPQTTCIATALGKAGLPETPSREELQLWGPGVKLVREKLSQRANSLSTGMQGSAAMPIFAALWWERRITPKSRILYIGQHMEAEAATKIANVARQILSATPADRQKLRVSPGTHQPADFDQIWPSWAILARF